jgi:putative Mn2+ efflux pump MntP
MSVVEIIILSAALGADLFSIAVPIGMMKVAWGRVIKASAVFALFHIGMILAGYFTGNWLGTTVEQFGGRYVSIEIMAVENIAKIFGAAVLALLGVYMVWENFSNDKSKSLKKLSSAASPLYGMSLIILAVSVSIDALAAGLSLGMMDVDLFKISAILGTVIFIISIAGLGVGRRLGSHIGAKAGLIGGFVLILLGFRILWELV